MDLDLTRTYTVNKIRTLGFIPGELSVPRVWLGAGRGFSSESTDTMEEVTSKEHGVAALTVVLSQERCFGLVPFFILFYFSFFPFFFLSPVTKMELKLKPEVR